MKLQFRVTLDDLMAFQKYYLDSIHFFGKVKFYNILLFGIMAIFFAFYDFSGFSVNYFRISIMGMIFILFSSIFLFTYEKRIMKKIRSAFENEGNSLLIGDTIMNITEETLSIDKQGIKQVYNWKTLLKYRKTKDHIFIFNGEMSAYIIPKKTLSGEDIIQVEKILEEKIKD